MSRHEAGRLVDDEVASSVFSPRCALGDVAAERYDGW